MVNQHASPRIYVYKCLREMPGSVQLDHYVAYSLEGTTKIWTGRCIQINIETRSTILIKQCNVIL